MICMRCQGRMVYGRFLDLIAGDYAFMGWRCVNCGEIRDQLIVSNRLSPGKPLGIGRRRAEEALVVTPEDGMPCSRSGGSRALSRDGCAAGHLAQRKRKALPPAGRS